MYILSGKGTVAGVDLAAYILERCQASGVLWDDDLPAYTLDFATQLPSVSKSIREGSTGELVKAIDEKLALAERANHRSYMLLCLTAHQLIEQLTTKLACVNLWDEVLRRTSSVNEPIAFLGTQESLLSGARGFITLERHVERMGDLITSVKRGYARLGDGYAAHPKHLLRKIVDAYDAKGISRFFLACTDLHVCKDYLVEFGISEGKITDIIEIAGDMVLANQGRCVTPSFLDATSDARTQFRYKYLAGSDAPRVEDKTAQFRTLLDRLELPGIGPIHILDIGGGSSGHSLTLAKKLAPRHCNITLQDASQASLEAAKPSYLAQGNATTTFACGDIATFEGARQYDVVVCLGLLLYVSDDATFAGVVRNVGDMTATGGMLLTRDCVHDRGEKVYLPFGGVVRPERLYDETFAAAGFSKVDETSFFIETPTPRKIKTALWTKRPGTASSMGGSP